MRLNRRRLPLRRFGRPGRPASSATPPPLDLPQDESRNGDSTEFAIPSVAEAASSSAATSPAAKSHESTVELPSVEPVIEEGGPLPENPIPPDRLKFACTCGAELVATAAAYDKKTRCGTCQQVLLLNLVFDPETGQHEIVPFEVNT
jgi:hypothetical protein